MALRILSDGGCRGVVKSWTPEERKAFEHLNTNIKSALESLPANEQEIIQRKTLELIGHPAPARRALYAAIYQVLCTIWTHAVHLCT